MNKFTNVFLSKLAYDIREFNLNSRMHSLSI